MLANAAQTGEKSKARPASMMAGRVFYEEVRHVRNNPKCKPYLPGQQAVMYAKRGDTRFYCLLDPLQDDMKSSLCQAMRRSFCLAKKPDGTLVTLPGQPDGKAWPRCKRTDTDAAVMQELSVADYWQ